MIDRYIDRYIFTTKQQDYQEAWPIWESTFHETPMGLILGIIIAGPDLLNFEGETLVRAMVDTGPPGPLVQSFTWARECLKYLCDKDKANFLLQLESAPMSTWFSGYGCAEQAMAMINAARLEKRSGEAFQPSHQYEINFKARQTSSFRLPEHTCQFIDIGRLLNVDDMKELKQLESASDELGEEVWKFLKGKKLQTTELCSRHKQRRCHFKNLKSDRRYAQIKGFTFVVLAQNR